MLSAETIARYAPPNGDLFLSYARLYGNNGALIISNAAQAGDPTLITDAIVQVKYGARLDDSTFNALWHQLSTDPLGAPLDALSSGVKSIINSSGVQTIAIVVGVSVVAYILYKASR